MIEIIVQAMILLVLVIVAVQLHTYQEINNLNVSRIIEILEFVIDTSTPDEARREIAADLITMGSKQSSIDNRSISEKLASSTSVWEEDALGDDEREQIG